MDPLGWWKHLNHATNEGFEVCGQCWNMLLLKVIPHRCCVITYICEGGWDKRLGWDRQNQRLGCEVWIGIKGGIRQIEEGRRRKKGKEKTESAGVREKDDCERDNNGRQVQEDNCSEVQKGGEVAITLGDRGGLKQK